MDDLRIYAQLKPTSPSRTALRSLQERLTLSDRARLIAPDRLHLTVIHFGRPSDIFATVIAVSPTDEAQFDSALMTYIASTEALMEGRSFRLEPAGLSGFGPRGSTLVAEFRSTPGLDGLHDGLLAVLRRFLSDCGIVAIDAFLDGNPNLMHARMFRPHITLCRGFSGRVPDVVLPAVELMAMPTLYPDRHC